MGFVLENLPAPIGKIVGKFVGYFMVLFEKASETIAKQRGEIPRTLNNQDLRPTTKTGSTLPWPTHLRRFLQSFTGHYIPHRRLNLFLKKVCYLLSREEIANGEAPLSIASTI